MSLKKFEANFKVDSKSQEFVIGDGALDQLPPFVSQKKYSRVIFFIDSTVGRFHGKKINGVFKKINLPKNKILISVEGEKSDFALFKILRQCVVNNLDRRGCLVGIGGGKIGDLVGLAAALYMRGVDFVQVGTTCMSQVDGILGKTAADYFGRKNIIGSFSSPVLTVCDTDFLKSISLGMIQVGLIEVAKHAFIRPRQFLNKLEQIIDGCAGNGRECFRNLPFKDLVSNSLKIKSNFVVNDFWDIKKQHMMLSYGHTLANAFEELSNYKIRHGEAVALGMLLAAEYSKQLGYLKRGEYERHNALVRKIINIKFPETIAFKEIFEVLKRDKSSYKKTPKMVILKAFGQGALVDIDPTILKKCFKKLSAK